MRTSSFLLVFVTGAIVGGATHWYLTQPRSRDMAVSAKEEVRESAHRVGDSARQTFDTDKIKQELKDTGRVVRDKASKAGEAVADAAANASTTAKIKTKLVADTGLAAFKIDVDTADSVVTLSGSVSSEEDIANAMRIALDTDGVSRVISTLSVKP